MSTVKRFSLLCLLLFTLSLSAADVMRLEYRRMEGGSVITGHGTCFGISKRELLTAAHNILDEKGKPHKELFMEVEAGWLRLKVLRWSAKYDLALLAAPIDVDPFELGADDVGPGATVILAGSKRGVPIEHYTGRVTERHFEGSCRDCMRVKFDHGDSGGPVTSGGQVVGVAVAGIPKDGDLDHEQGLYVPASIVKEFLEGK